jgi:hypothetical protein
MNEDEVHQRIITIQMLKMLDLYEKEYESHTNAPYNINYKNTHEIAPYTLVLEEDCPFGNMCIYKKIPLICSRNHQKLGKYIIKNTIIPNYLCKYERPWKKNLNGLPMYCTNNKCWFSHLKGRVDFLESYQS